MASVLSPCAIKWLKAASWSEDYRWPIEPILEDELRKAGHRPNPAALRFLAHYGGLEWHRFNPYQPNAGTLMCHTNALTVAEKLVPAWCEAGAAEPGSSLCPIGEDGYGHFLVAMDEQGRVYGMAADTGEWKEFNDSGEEYLDNSDWAIAELIKPGGRLPRMPKGD